MTHPTVACVRCGVPLTIGVDAHEHGLDDMGRELFVCAAHCPCGREGTD